MVGDYFIVKEKNFETNFTFVKHNHRPPVVRKKEKYMYIMHENMSISFQTSLHVEI